MTHHRFVLSDELWQRMPHCYRVGPPMVAFIQNWGHANPIAARPRSHACVGIRPAEGCQRTTHNLSQRPSV